MPAGSRISIRIPIVLVAIAVVAAATTVAFAGDDQKRIVDPLAGKSNQERMVAIQDSKKEFTARYAAWLADFAASGRDPRSLKRVEMLVTALDPQPDLATAVRNASAIVRVHAESVEFNASGSAVVTLSVTGSAKGTPGRSIRIVQAGGPAPDAQWGIGTLGYAASDPLLLPGDDAVLFLEGPYADGSYGVQSYTGSYLVNDGKLEAVEGNPFRAEIRAVSPDALLATTKAMASH